MPIVGAPAVASRAVRGLLASLAVLVVCGLAGCADNVRDTARTRAAYVASAGAPVPSFRLYGRISSWEALGQDHAVIYTRPDQAWLLDVPGCHDLDFTSAIGLTSRMDVVRVGFDKVTTGARTLPCTIVAIRPLDLVRFRALKDTPPR